MEELPRRAAVSTLVRFGFVVLPCRVFAGFRLTVPSRLTYPSRSQTALAYHIVRVVVQDSKTDRPLAELGQNPNASRTLARRLWPATDMPATLAWAVECQFETPTEEA
jgi:hypothetical protein